MAALKSLPVPSFNTPITPIFKIMCYQLSVFLTLDLLLNVPRRYVVVPHCYMLSCLGVYMVFTSKGT